MPTDTNHYSKSDDAGWTWDSNGPPFEGVHPTWKNSETGYQTCSPVTERNGHITCNTSQEDLNDTNVVPGTENEPL